jgi:hypothetical protein
VLIKPGDTFGEPAKRHLGHRHPRGSEVAAWEIAALGDATDEGLAAMLVGDPA